VNSFKTITARTLYQTTPINACGEQNAYVDAAHGWHVPQTPVG
jgi:hypothetical protein